MNKINKISIILSVFNGEEYLKYAIESIQNQTFIFFDFIIVDNGSTDRTNENIIKSELYIEKKLLLKKLIQKF